VFIEIKGGSSEENDLTFTLSDSDEGGANYAEQWNTAINFFIIDMNRRADITNHLQDWMVGQVTDDLVIVEAPNDWVSSSTFHWTVPGNVLSGYFPSTQQATTEALEDPDVDTLQCFWVATTAIPPD